MTMKKTTAKKKSTSHANRGLKFEAMMENKCEQLEKEGICSIHKVPTEMKMIRNGARIVNAFPVEGSKFVDFVGVYNGQAIAIELKETKNKTSFPFKNIKKEQIQMLNIWEEFGGKSYYLIRFEEHKRVFLIPCKILHNCIDTIERASAPYNWFLETGGVIEVDYKELDFEKYI